MTENTLDNAIKIWGAPEDIPIDDLINNFWIEKVNCVGDYHSNIAEWYIRRHRFFNGVPERGSLADQLICYTTPLKFRGVVSINEQDTLRCITAAYAFSLITNQRTKNSDGVCMFGILNDLGVSVSDHIMIYQDAMSGELDLGLFIEELSVDFVSVEGQRLNSKQQRCLSAVESIKSKVDQAVLRAKAALQQPTNQYTVEDTVEEEFDSL